MGGVLGVLSHRFFYFFSFGKGCDITFGCKEGQFCLLSEKTGINKWFLTDPTLKLFDMRNEASQVSFNLTRNSKKESITFCAIFVFGLKTSIALLARRFPQSPLVALHLWREIKLQVPCLPALMEPGSLHSISCTLSCGPPHLPLCRLKLLHFQHRPLRKVTLIFESERVITSSCWCLSSVIKEWPRRQSCLCLQCLCRKLRDAGASEGFWREIQSSWKGAGEGRQCPVFRLYYIFLFWVLVLQGLYGYGQNTPPASSDAGVTVQDGDEDEEFLSLPMSHLSKSNMWSPGMCRVSLGVRRRGRAFQIPWWEIPILWKL